MKEMENPKSLAERVARIEDRLGLLAASNSLTALSWMRWIPATVGIRSSGVSPGTDDELV